MGDPALEEDEEFVRDNSLIIKSGKSEEMPKYL
jgi:hypothetical protein